MKNAAGRFNTYLLASCLGLAAALGAGCSTAGKEKREQSTLRLHLEVNADKLGHNTTAAVGRTSPFEVPIEKEPFLTEFNVEKAGVADTPGGFVINIQFTAEGAITLEHYTGSYNSRRIVIGAEFGPTRWLAAPIIRQRVADGRLVFTPDASRAEAERFVRGLNRVAELVKKGRK